MPDIPHEFLENFEDFRIPWNSYYRFSLSQKITKVSACEAHRKEYVSHYFLAHMDTDKHIPFNIIGSQTGISLKSLKNMTGLIRYGHLKDSQDKQHLITFFEIGRLEDNNKISDYYDWTKVANTQSVGFMIPVSGELENDIIKSTDRFLFIYQNEKIGSSSRLYLGGHYLVDGLKVLLAHHRLIPKNHLDCDE